MISIAKYVWRDLTPLGRYTIGVPLVVAVYLAVMLMIPVFAIFFVLIKSGLADRIESLLERIKKSFFKGVDE
jgi:hypothetical protein